jgi:hypothetical protein
MYSAATRRETRKRGLVLVLAIAAVGFAYPMAMVSTPVLSSENGPGLAHGRRAARGLAQPLARAVNGTVQTSRPLTRDWSLAAGSSSRYEGGAPWGERRPR